MEVFGSTDVKNLPSAILQIRSKNGLSYSSANNRQGVMDFEIPSSLGYFLGSGVNLSFDMLDAQLACPFLEAEVALRLKGLFQEFDGLCIPFVSFEI